MDSTKTLWLPEKASNFAESLDSLFYGFLWLSVFFFVLIVGLMVYFVWKYARRRPEQLAQAQVTHNLKLELFWSIVPTIIVMVLFYVGFVGFLDMQVAPSNSMEIKVTGQKWFWTFGYPDGTQSDTLVVPVDRPVRLVMTSRDVLHSLFIPAFRVKQDVIPNRFTSLWFEATREGVFPLYCTEYCGTKHSDMITSVKVLGPDDYQAWQEAQASAGQDLPPAEFGATLYTKKGCNACHSIDGTAAIGPTWKGAYGTQRALASGGTVEVDENYIRESILNPGAKITAGFQPVMPAYQGIVTDAEIEAIIEYMKTL